jgi:hypothetical protein
MPLRALRKAMVAFATFDSVAACRACATQSATRDVPSRESKAAPSEAGTNQQAAEAASSERASRADDSPDAKA